MAGSYSGFLGRIGGDINAGQRDLGITLQPGEFPRQVQITHSGGLITLNQQCDNGEIINVVLSNGNDTIKHVVVQKILYDQGSGWNPIALVRADWTDLAGATLRIGFDSGLCTMNNAETVTITTNFATTYTITWNRDNGSANVTSTVYYGLTPTYPEGTNPTKASTAQYSYSFSGWSPTVGPAYGNKTYTAQYTATTRSYTVTWKDWDGTTLATETKAYGTTPSRSGPSRASTAQYNYTFAGWSPTPTAVTGNAVYTATYTQVLRSYTITWQDYDGTVLATETKAYGTTPSRDGPSRPSTAQYSYTFAGWNPSPAPVTGNAIYTATYTQSLRSYTIVWQQDDGTLIDTTTVAYGEVPTHADAVKAPDVDFTYTFAGWSPTVVAVTGTATYKATYTATPNHRTVKYYDGMIWIECIPFVWNGTEWDEVEPYYYNGTDWVLCSQG